MHTTAQTPATDDDLLSRACSSRRGDASEFGPGRDLVFKLTADETGAARYFIVEVAPHGGPPLHVHHFSTRRST